MDLRKLLLELSAEIDRLNSVRTAILPLIVPDELPRPAARKRKHISAAGRRKIAAAQRARWAKVRRAK